MITNIKKMKQRKKTKIVMAEDDFDDRLLIKDASEEAGLDYDITFLDDGVELLDYLYKRGEYQAEGTAPQPDFILLDLKMPRKNGWEVLEEIQADPLLQGIPIFVLTTSTDEDDRRNALKLGADGYFTKQVTFDGLVDVMKKIGKAWGKV